MALLLAQARNIPQAHAALVAGKWERSKWEGVELHGKTLGVVGPRPGRCPGGPAGARLRHAPRRLRPLRVRRPGQAHGGRADEPRGADGRVGLRHRPPAQEQGDPRPHRRGACWRSPSPACASSTPRAVASSTRRRWPQAIRDGHVQGAGLDVFAKEPTTESPLFELPSVVVAPHLGASTVEAQDKAGRHHRRAGHPGAGRRLRALRRERQRHRRVRDRPAVHGPGRAARPDPRRTRGRPARTPSRSSTRAAWPARARASSPCRC